MKRLFLASFAFVALASGSAMAADMAVKATPMVAAPFSWTGLYFGIEAGYGHGDANSTRTVADTFFPIGFANSLSSNGALLGAEAGYNYQFNWFVLGIETDWQGSSVKGSSSTVSALVPADTVFSQRETDWVGTVTGRLGLAWDRWMIFGKGGAAWRHVNDAATNVATVTATGALVASSSIFSSTESGYVVGGGIEWAPVDIVSFKVEYDWYNFGTNAAASSIRTCCGAPVGTVTGSEANVSSTMWEMKGAINFHFNPFLSGPVVARY